MIRLIAVHVEKSACMRVCVVRLRLELIRYQRTEDLLQTAEGGLLGTSCICCRALAQLPFIEAKSAILPCRTGASGANGAEGDVWAHWDLWVRVRSSGDQLNPDLDGNELNLGRACTLSSTKMRLNQSFSIKATHGFSWLPSPRPGTTEMK